MGHGALDAKRLAICTAEDGEGLWWTVDETDPEEPCLVCTNADLDEDGGCTPAVFVPASVAAERDRLREALASMPMPEAGPGMAWPTEYCPFCEWEGKPDRLIPPAKQDHDADCPVRLARAALASTAPGLEGDGE